MSRSEEKRSKFRGDVWYDTWRFGGNPDLVDDDRVDDCFDSGVYSDECAIKEIRRQRGDKGRNY